MSVTAPPQLPGVSGERFAVRTVSLPRAREEHLRYAGAHEALVTFLYVTRSQLGFPDTVFLEEPFGGGGKGQPRTVHPSSHRIIGVILAAVGEVFPQAHLEFIGPQTWKKESVGHGHADKASIFAWACQQGYTGALQDEADAYGIACAGARRLVRDGRPGFALGIDPSTLRVSAAACWPA